MSDNPADSLRREQLFATIRKALFTTAYDNERGHDIRSQRIVEAIEPLVLAAVEAARADERERLEKAVEAHRGKILMATGATDLPETHPPHSEH